MNRAPTAPNCQLYFRSGVLPVSVYHAPSFQAVQSSGDLVCYFWDVSVPEYHLRCSFPLLRLQRPVEGVTLRKQHLAKVFAFPSQNFDSKSPSRLEST